MKFGIRALCALAAVGLISVAVAVPALASSRPVVTSMSSHHGIYWGGALITVRGQNFSGVQKVLFGAKKGYAVHVVSSTKLTVREPGHKYGKIHVRVVTSAGTSFGTDANWFTFTRPTMSTPIQGGLTGRQEQSISAKVRQHHKNVHTAPRARAWTPAMGQTAMKRAYSWLGLPYSWAGGNSRGPTLGVCAHNGGDLDCHIVGFDCSGLTMYAWAPYKSLVHYAASQYRSGKFHPTIGELMPGDLVFFSGYLPSGIGHVVIYEGNGWVIQAEQSGTPVMRSRLTDVLAESGTYRGATRPTSTGRQGAGPRVTSMTSQLSVVGGYVTINGSNLSGVQSVWIGGRYIYSFAQRSAGRLVVKAPVHAAGTVSVVVSNAWGNAKRSMAYVAAPQIGTFNPTTAPTDSATSVTVTGRYLTTVSKVTVGSAQVPFTVLSSSQLRFTTPAISTPGPQTVILYSRWGNSIPKSLTFTTPPSSSARTAGHPSSSSPPPSSSSAPPSSGSAPPSSSAPPKSSSTPPSSSPAPPSSSSVPPSGSTSTSPSTSPSPGG